MNIQKGAPLLGGLAAVLTVFLGLGPARARDLSGEFLVSSAPGGGFGVLPDAAMDRQGEVLVVWGEDSEGFFGRRFGRDGSPRGDDFQVGMQVQTYLGLLDASLDANGFTVVWGEFSTHSGSRASLRRYDRSDQPLTDAVGLSREAFAGPPSVGTDARGNSVVVLPEGQKIVGRRFDAQGRRIRSFEVTPGPASTPKVAVAGNGSFVVAWLDRRQGTVYGRRFDAAANPVGPLFVVAPEALNLAVAGNAQGNVAIAWVSDFGISARTFGPRGLRPKVDVTPSAPADTQLSMAMDAAGRFLVTWSNLIPSRIFGRFFESSGAPLDRPFPVSLRNATTDFNPSAAAGPAGDFLVVWQQFSALEGGGIAGRFLDWSPRGADPCLSGAGAFACDVSRDGGAPEITVPLARPPGAVPLLGDLDGDGRDDPCRFRDGRFFCDRTHDGLPDLRIDFGQPGDMPLLGDLDGEGRADPCVRRGAQILCDTAHNGGTAEVVVTFGAAGSPVLLGDVDGDGDDDPCLPGGGRLSCDTEHDGGAAELQIPLATQAGDVPLLADVDGDGRADPCVFRGGRFLCDPRRSGSLSPFGLPFAAEPGAIPVLGNVNGI